MKIVFLNLVLLLSISYADREKSFDDVAKRQIADCIASELNANEIYLTIEDPSFKNKSDLPQIIAYRNSLSTIVDKCSPIYRFHDDVEQAKRLVFEVNKSIVDLKK